MTRYDSIGHGYRRTRREDPRIAARVHRALGDARTVVNVGAGAGSYEPRDRHVVAIEPSDVMASQRPRDVAPAIRASAGALPLREGSVDAAMFLLGAPRARAGRGRTPGDVGVCPDAFLGRRPCRRGCRARPRGRHLGRTPRQPPLARNLRCRAAPRHRRAHTALGLRTRSASAPPTEPNREQRMGMGMGMESLPRSPQSRPNR
jgi:hypothetical protein